MVSLATALLRSQDELRQSGMLVCPVRASAAMLGMKQNKSGGESEELPGLRL